MCLNCINMPNSNLKIYWLSFIKLATFLLAIEGTFIIVPPLLSYNPDSIIKPLARFIISSIIALTFIPLSKYSQKIHYMFWYKISIGTFVTAILLFAIYFFLINSWSIVYYKDRLVKGEHMLKEAANRKDSLALYYNKPIDDLTLLKARLGKTQTIWPSNELNARFYILTVIYIACISSFAFFLIAIFHAIYCFKLSPI